MSQEELSTAASTYDSLPALWDAATRLAQNMREDADRLEATGALPAPELLDALTEYRERVMALADDGDPPADLEALAATQAAQIQRAQLGSALAELRTLRATQPGYEQSIELVHGAAVGLAEAHDDPRAQQLLWLHAVLAGRELLGPVDFAQATERLRASGLPEQLALGLIAGHLEITCAANDEPGRITRDGSGMPPSASLPDATSVTLPTAGSTPQPVEPPAPSGSPAEGQPDGGAAATEHDVASPAVPVPDGVMQTGTPPHGAVDDDTHTAAQAVEVADDPSEAQDAAPGAPTLGAGRPGEDAATMPPVEQVESSDVSAAGPSPTEVHHSEPPESATPKSATEASAIDAPTVDPDPEPNVSPPSESASQQSIGALVSALRADEVELAHWIARTDSALADVAGALAAVVLARVLNDTRRPLLTAFDNAVTQSGQAELGDASAILLCAAALRGALVAPYGHSAEVLRQHARRLPHTLSDVAELIAERAPRGDLVGLAGEARGGGELSQQRASLQAEARRLIEEAPQRSTSYVPARRIWLRLVTAGELSTILAAVAKGADDTAARTAVERLSAVGAVERLLDTQDYGRRRQGRGGIVSHARDWLIDNVTEIIDLGTRWQRLLNDLGNGERRESTGWIRDQILERAPDVARELEALAEDADPLIAASSAVLARTAWEPLRELADQGNPPRPAWNPIGSADAFGGMLGRVRDLELADDLSPTEVPSIEALAAALGTSLSDAHARRLERHDHHVTQVLRELMGAGDVELAARLERTDREQLGRARDQLERERRDLRRRLDRAYGEQTIDDDERAELQVVLDEDPGSPNISRQRTALAAQRALLERRSAEACSRIREQVAELAPAKRIALHIDELLEAGQIVVANEFVARLQVGDRDFDELEPPLDATRLVTFLQRFDGRREQPAEMLARRKQKVDGGDAAAMRELITRSRTGTIKRDDAEALAKRVLTTVGFEDVTLTRAESHGNLTVVMTATTRVVRQGCPVPELGSRAKGRYRVMVTADPRGEEDLLNRVREARKQAGQPLIVILRSALDFEARQGLARLARQQRVPFLLIDRAVLALLATEDRERPRPAALFAAALPFSWSNPYVTHGVVPPEMFFGRDRELTDLTSPAGSVFLYGGRQLGKSAVLRRILEDFDASLPQHHAVYLDLEHRRIGFDGPTDLVWSHLGQELEIAGGLENAGRDSVSVRATIRRLLDEDPLFELRILLDEADHFLQQEATAGRDGSPAFASVIDMRALMQESDGRVKFVLAGLHSVQRFLHLPNQPFAQLGAPTPIGPLSWPDARELVERPLSALGYQLDAHVTDRILTLSSRHPSLAQHICWTLVDHMTRKARSRVPMRITLDDLDDAYEDRNLRVEIRKRFDWTLDLDPRYRVLAYALALRSLDDRRVQADGLTVGELQAEAGDWWRDGFAGLSRDEVETLADEMVNLLVFARVGGRYRLWSPNVMQLLGTREEVEERLLAEAERADVTRFEPSVYRRSLRSAQPAGPRSPMTFADERALLGDGPPVRLVCGSDATHVGKLVEALKSAVDTPDWPQLAFREHKRTPSPHVLNPRKSDDQSRLVVHVAPVENVAAGWLVERVAELAAAITQRSDVKAVVLVLKPEMLAHWVPIADQLEVDEDLAAQARLIVLKRWEEGAIAQWLDDLQLPSSAAQRAQVLRVTGGWPELVQRFAALAVAQDRRLDDMISAADRPEFRQPLLATLPMDRLAGLSEAADEMAQYGSLSAVDLADLLDGVNFAQAQDLLGALDLLQALGAEPGSDAGHLYALEPTLAAALRPPA